MQLAVAKIISYVCP